MRNLLFKPKLHLNSECLRFSRKSHAVGNTGFQIPQIKAGHVGDAPTGIYCGELVLKTFPETIRAPVSTKSCTQVELWWVRPTKALHRKL